MRKVRIEKLRGLAAVGAVLVGGWLVWVPGAAADVTLVDAVGSLAVRAQNDVDQTGEVSFTDVFREEVVANEPRVASRANQDTVLGTAEGFLATIDTSAFIEASARERPGNEATAAAQLRVTFETDAPTTMQIQGVLAVDHSVDGDRCLEATVDVIAGGSNWQAVATCDGVSELVIDDEIPLNTGTHTVFVNTNTTAEPFRDGDSSDGSASWNLSIGLCPNDFTEGDDIISGTPGDDVLCGGGGNDSIDGGEGHDIIFGGAGSDSITGGAGNDKIEGNGGQDFVQAGPGDDTIGGGDGDDGDIGVRISGGPGDDTIDGGDGSDFIDGDLGNDVIHGGADTDFDSLEGCNRDDPLCDADRAELDAAGVTDSDIITAGAGDSNIGGGADIDVIDGGPGFDFIRGGPEGDVIDAGGGGDRVLGGDGRDEIEGGPGHESGTSEGLRLGIFGGPGNDTSRGGAGDDLIEGGDGRDEMRGEAGSDKLRGQDGPDCLTGGTRKDVLVGGEGKDRLLARDGVRDKLNGGSQFDRARIDDVDDVTGVENRNFQGGCP